MPVVVLDAVDGADIGMVQLRSRPSLAREAFQRFGVANQIFRDTLQGHVPAQFQVFRLIDHAHSPAPKLAKDAVMGHLLTNHERVGPYSAVMLGPRSSPVNSLVFDAVLGAGGASQREYCKRSGSFE